MGKVGSDLSVRVLRATDLGEARDLVSRGLVLVFCVGDV